MLKFTDEQIAAVLESDINGEKYDDISPDEKYDLAMELLTAESPEVAGFTAEQDLGEYGVVIRGVQGAYIVQAQDFDDEGVFSTLGKAKSAALFQHGEFKA
jgi:hypothetical protein